MTVLLGLDIGSNSVGSAWVDTEQHVVQVGVTIFPAGVDETDTKRGAPLNQKRRQKRQQRKGIARRAKRKYRLRRHLIVAELFPSNPGEVQSLLQLDPWELRRAALEQPLTPHQFGRILLHLAQRRGAVGLKEIAEEETAQDDAEKEDKEKNEKDGAEEATLAKARKHTQELLDEHGVRTYGELIWKLLAARQAHPLDANGIPATKSKYQRDPVRNRHNLLVDKPELAVYADRELIRNEFAAIWKRQKELTGPLAAMLTDELRLSLDDPELKRFDGTADSQRQRKYRETWRHGGELFGQRKTYWDTGTLGRCDLEPTDERCPMADMYAQEFRVVETVNNIRLRERGQLTWQPLKPEQRETVINFLRGGEYYPAPSGRSKKPLKPKKAPKFVEPKHIREILGIGPKALEKKGVPADFYELNLDQDAERAINADWFYREIVHGVFGETIWKAFSPRQQESINAALQRFDPEKPEHETRVNQGADTWWKITEDQKTHFLAAWRKRPKLENRVRLSRRAIRNLLPYMSAFDAANNRWPTQIEACIAFAADTAAVDRMSGLSEDEKKEEKKRRQRYDPQRQRLTKAEKHYMKKHPESLPPAPTLSNPVVRKAIHEVRRHVLAYIKKFGRKPDRIVIEMARSAKQPEKVRNFLLKVNHNRRRLRQQIIESHQLERLSLHQQNAAVDRVLLCRQQRGVCPYTGLLAKDGCYCPYSGKAITERMAADGHGLELDHIIPRSWGGSNGLNNLLLCFRGANAGKSDLPPKTWLRSEEPFLAFLKRLEHFRDEAKKQWSAHDYFMPKDYARKWESLHCDQRPKEWTKSQLNDTAYAAKEVAGYLRNALFADETADKQKIFFTKGSYTFLLRSDWKLFQLLKAPRHELDRQADAEAEKKLAEKDRNDHRHHAIDAVCIALAGPELLQQLAHDSAAIERAKAEAEDNGQDAPVHRIRRQSIAPPWSTLPEFRKQVLSLIFESFDGADERGYRTPTSEHGVGLVVSHRPVKRKVTGYLHKEDLWGAVDEENKTFRIRCNVSDLTAKMLRMPEPESDDEIAKRLSAQLRSSGMKPKEAKLTVEKIMKSKDVESYEAALDRLDTMYGGSQVQTSNELAVDKPKYKRRFIEPSLGKGGLVRDWALRRIIRDCLRREGISPETIADKRFKELAAAGKFLMPSGVPIKTVVTIGPISAPIKIAVRDPWTGQQAINSRTGQPLFRYHFSRNNHHAEILADQETGEWSLRGRECVTVYDATRRVRSSIRHVIRLKNGRQAFTSIADNWAVDQSNTATHSFVMSLSEGETILASRKDTGVVGFYVVAKLDDDRVEFVPHNDAGKAKAQDRWDVTYADLRNCEIEPGKPPVKVRVSPLGDYGVHND